MDDAGVSAVAAEERLRLLRKLLQSFSTPDCWFDVNLVWENDFGRAGVYTNDQSASVFLNNAILQVNELADAEYVLRGIFADEIVSVTLYTNEEFDRCELVPLADLPLQAQRAEDEIANRNRVIETWSKGMLKDE